MFRMGRERGVSPVIATILLVAVTVTVAIAAFAMLSGLGPGEPTSQPATAFDIDKEDDGLYFEPMAIDEGVELDLRINGKTVYTWNGTMERRKVTCVFPQDRIMIINDVKGGTKEYVNSKVELDQPTACDYGGPGSKFAYAKVGDRRIPLRSSKYSFTASIDPDGSCCVNGDKDYPSTNEWHWMKRYDKKIEGLEPPNYVIVFADNVNDWDDDAPELTQAYKIQGTDVVPNASGSNEPTNDIYMVFSPGCDQSKLKFIDDRAGYSNDILVDGTKVIDNTNTATEGKVFDAPGVQCLEE